MTLGTGEIEREGRRVLRKLALPGAKLVEAEGTYVLAIPGAGATKPRLRVAPALVDAFRRRDWIEPSDDPNAWLLSDAGEGWLKRALAGSDVYAAQHRSTIVREVAAPDGTTARVEVNEAESPLGWLSRRRGPDGKPLIGRSQFDAGERLRKDFTLAQLTPRMAVDLAAPVVAGRRGAKDAPLTETVIAARQRFRRALDAVAAERGKGWPQRSAKVVLAIALERLAAHYGIGQATGAGSRIRAWQSPDLEDGEKAVRDP